MNILLVLVLTFNPTYKAAVFIAAMLVIGCSQAVSNGSIDMEQQNRMAQDWLDAKPHTDVAWVGVTHGMVLDGLNVKQAAARLPSAMCYDIWQGKADNMPDETRISLTENCHYLASRLQETMNAFGFEMATPEIAKSAHLRNLSLDYEGPKIDCVIGKADRSKMPAWSSSLPMKEPAPGDIMGCNGQSPYEVDRLFSQKPGVIPRGYKYRYTLEELPLWKFGRTD